MEPTFGNNVTDGNDIGIIDQVARHASGSCVRVQFGKGKKQFFDFGELERAGRDWWRTRT